MKRKRARGTLTVQIGCFFWHWPDDFQTEDAPDKTLVSRIRNNPDSRSANGGTHQSDLWRACARTGSNWCPWTGNWTRVHASGPETSCTSTRDGSTCIPRKLAKQHSQHWVPERTLVMSVLKSRIRKGSKQTKTCIETLKQYGHSADVWHCWQKTLKHASWSIGFSTISLHTEHWMNSAISSVTREMDRSANAGRIWNKKHF